MAYVVHAVRREKNVERSAMDRGACLKKHRPILQNEPQSVSVIGVREGGERDPHREIPTTHSH